MVGLVGELEDRGRVRGRRDDAHHDQAGRVGVVSRGARRRYGDGVVREEVRRAAEPVAPRLGEERPARRRRDAARRRLRGARARYGVDACARRVQLVRSEGRDVST